MKFKLEISNPCSENWNQMPQSERGRFCDKCQKNVIDFTNSNDLELYNLILNDDKICGKITQEQLNKVIEINKRKRQFKNSSLILGLTSLFATTQPIFSQNKQTSTFQTDEKNEANKTLTKNILIKGTVIDSSKTPIPEVAVMIENTTIKTFTDFDGNYSIEVPESMIKPDLHLIFSMVGYFSQKKLIKRNLTEINILLKEDKSQEELIVVIGGIHAKEIKHKRKNFFSRIGNLFKRKK